MIYAQHHGFYYFFLATYPRSRPRNRLKMWEWLILWNSDVTTEQADIFVEWRYEPLLPTARIMWSITTSMIDRRGLLLPFLWEKEICAVLLACWQYEKVCGCALWWQSDVRVGVFVSSCMVGICSLFDGCSHFPCSGKKKKKLFIFWFVGFQAKELPEHCSLQATSWRGLQTAGLKITFGVVFLIERGSDGVTDWVSVYDGKHMCFWKI